MQRGVVFWDLGGMLQQKARGLRGPASAAARPACFRVAQMYSTPFASAALLTSPAATPFFAAKPVSALVAAPLAS